MGDALAVTLMKARDFKPENFARFHPGGSLGRRLLCKVEDEMTTSNLPLVNKDANVLDVIHTMSYGSLGLAIVELADDWGLITDGDIRRAIERYNTAVFVKTASELMTHNPTRVPIGTRVEDALQLMERLNITSLLVFEGQRVVGVFKK
ncbi:Arabinose 5-phosphate isomerase KpsF [compost metagenome]